MVDGQFFSQIVLNLTRFVRERDKAMCVADALHDKRWVSAIRGTPSVLAILDFLYENQSRGTILSPAASP